MKKIFPVLVVFLIGWACSTQKKATEVKPRTVEVAGQDSVASNSKDSVEYSIETFDPKFESWYEMHKNETAYHSEQYYEQWNRQYVSAWNANATDPRKSAFFEPIVGYNPNVDYGLELNHKLFYYFQYVENVLKIKIMPVSPRAVPF